MRLEFKDRLQGALRISELVGCVRGEEIAAVQQEITAAGT
jgi:hypothetical protein